MKSYRIIFGVILIIIVLPSYASNDANILNQITDNIMKVCDKPENAGSYWDIKVRGDGDAEIKLKLADIGVTGEAAFSKSEWDGIQRTVEDNKDYRDCVKSLSPMFVEKFSPLISASIQKEIPRKRILGGVKWQELGGGLKVTLSSCYRQSSSVICEFIVNSMGSDSSINISEYSAIYDQTGNKFVPSQISLANFKSIFRDNRSRETMYGELVKNVDTIIKAKFNNVGEESLLVRKAILISTIKQQGASKENHTFTFRDIKIALN